MGGELVLFMCFYYYKYILIIQGYAISIADQMGLRGKPKPITELGSPLNEEMLECFRTEQILQLYELLKASEILESDPKAAKPNKKS